MARIHPVSHTIGFTQSVNGGVGQELSHTIGFTHSVDPGESLWNHLVTDAIGFQDAVSYYFEGGCDQKQYNRYEGSGSATGIPEEPLTFSGQFALESLEGTRETLYLRNPETDDKQRVGYSRINRESRGGELVVYQDPAWGSCPDKIGDLQDFFQDHLGQEMLIHDWEGITWKGVIVTPNETAVEDRDGWWTISWEFIGEALEGDEMDQHLNFTQTVHMNADWVRPIAQTIGLSDTVGWSILGQQVGAASQSIGFTDTVTGILEHPTMEDDFSGAGAVLNGTSPDVGTGLWAAHSDYLDNGLMTGINSGAYYPFAPASGKVYEIEWETSSILESDGLETRCFLGEGLPTNPELVGPTIYGNSDPTTLKAGFVLRDLGGTQDNACRLGDHSDGEADTASFTDGTLKIEDDAIDLQLKLDTTGGAGNWTVTWYAKDPAASTWTQVRAETSLLDENITMMGWSNNNTTTTITMDDARIIERTDIT
jgi:hypothetical protein